MKENSFDIAIAFDHIYVQFGGVLIYSILLFNKNHNINLHILHDESLTVEDKENILRIVSQFDRCTINFYYIDVDFTNIVLEYSMHKTAYFRLLVADILPKSINKLLYLDSDTLVVGDLSVLFNEDIDNYSIAACIDSLEYSVQNFNRLKIDLGDSKEYSYFNSGVLLINLEYWRNNDVIQQIKLLINDYIHKNGIFLKFHDQDLLNLLFISNKKIISSRYNYMIAFSCNGGFRNKCIREKYFNMLEEAEKNPIILHFTGPNFKPWEINYGHNPYNKIWGLLYKLAYKKQIKRKIRYKMYFKNVLKRIFSILRICDNPKKIWAKESYVYTELKYKELLDKTKGC